MTHRYAPAAAVRLVSLLSSWSTTWHAHTLRREKKIAADESVIFSLTSSLVVSGFHICYGRHRCTFLLSNRPGGPWHVIESTFSNLLSRFHIQTVWQLQTCIHRMLPRLCARHKKISLPPYTQGIVLLPAASLRLNIIFKPSISDYGKVVSLSSAMLLTQ